MAQELEFFGNGPVVPDGITALLLQQTAGLESARGYNLVYPLSPVVLANPVIDFELHVEMLTLQVKFEDRLIVVLGQEKPVMSAGWPMVQVLVRFCTVLNATDVHGAGSHYCG